MALRMQLMSMATRLIGLKRVTSQRALKTMVTLNWTGTLDLHRKGVKSQELRILIIRGLQSESISHTRVTDTRLTIVLRKRTTDTTTRRSITTRSIAPTRARVITRRSQSTTRSIMNQNPIRSIIIITMRLNLISLVVLTRRMWLPNHTTLVSKFHKIVSSQFTTRALRLRSMKQTTKL